MSASEYRQTEVSSPICPPQLYAKEKKSGERMRKELLKTACVHRREVGVLSAEADRRSDFAVAHLVIGDFKLAQVKQHLLGDDSGT